MKKILLFFVLFFMTISANAGIVTIPTTWATGDTVTATKLNNINSAFANVINGGLDNDNANTSSGYHFFKSVAALPAAGSQGNVYFLTSNNTLNLDTGSAFVVSVVANGSPAQGDILYYNSGWQLLTAGTKGQCLMTNGSSANPAYAGMSTTGDMEYFNGTTRTVIAAGSSGTFLKSNGSSIPTWVAPVGSILDYGTSASASTSKQSIALRVAYGTIDVGSMGTQAITNLPFTNSSSYVVTVMLKAGGGTALAQPGVTNDSGAQFTISNNIASTKTMTWIAIGS